MEPCRNRCMARQECFENPQIDNINFYIPLHNVKNKTILRCLEVYLQLAIKDNNISQ